MKLYCIKSQRLASHLMTKGFKLVKMDADRNNPSYNVFFFNYTEELLREITDFTVQLNKNKSIERSVLYDK